MSIMNMQCLSFTGIKLVMLLVDLCSYPGNTSVVMCIWGLCRLCGLGCS